MSTEEAEEFAQMHNVDNFEVLAKAGANLDAMFDRLVVRTVHLIRQGDSRKPKWVARGKSLWVTWDESKEALL